MKNKIKNIIENKNKLPVIQVSDIKDQLNKDTLNQLLAAGYLYISPENNIICYQDNSIKESNTLCVRKCLIEDNIEVYEILKYPLTSRLVHITHIDEGLKYYKKMTREFIATSLKIMIKIQVGGWDA